MQISQFLKSETLIGRKISESRQTKQISVFDLIMLPYKYCRLTE